MTNFSSWRGDARSVYGWVFPLALLVFGASLLLGFGGSFRVWGALPPIALDPTALAAKLFAKGDLEGAEREYRIAGQVYPSGAATQEQLVAIYERTGDRDAIVRLYRREVASNPFEPKSRYALGVALLSSGQTGEGIATLEGLHQAAPAYPGLHHTLGKAYFDSGRFPAAEAVLQEGLRADPLSASMHEGLGLTLERLGRMGEAEREFERAFQIDPGRTSARDNLRRLQYGVATP